MITCLHTHTVFCDGKDDVETMCLAAYEKGLAAIGFSSHAPVDSAGLESTWNLPGDRLGEYITEVYAARRRWEGKIAVYLGLEVDYIKGLRTPLDTDIIKANLDYSIGSVHYLIPEGTEPFTVDAPAAEVHKAIMEGYGGSGEAMMHAYWDAVAEMAAIGGFDIVGHFDLVKKHSAAFHDRQDLWFDRHGDVYMQRVEEAVRAVAAAGLTVEINTGALNRGHLNEPYPSLPVWRLLRRYNVPAIITADAHRADHLGGCYEEARQVLIEAGYSHHVTFEGKKNGMPVWREYPL